MSGGESSSYLCTKVKSHQGMWKLLGNQVDEPHYETVGEGNRNKDKERSDDC